MKKYKVIEAKDSKEAEELMNTFSQDGWEVLTVTYWQKINYRLVITFVKE